MARRSGNFSRVVVGTKDEVLYTGASTRDDAAQLGNALQETGFFTNRGASVLLKKKKHVTVVSFILDQGTWEHSGAVANFEELGRRIAPSIGGFPIRLQLVDSTGTVRESLDL